MSDLTPGTKVLYVPSLDHWHETDRSGSPLFLFAHVKDGPPAPPGRKRAAAGEPVEDGGAVVRTAKRRLDDGSIMLSDDQTIVRPLRALSAWPGVVREEIARAGRKVNATVEGKEQEVVVFDETASLVLDVTHPNGVVTLSFPLDGESAPAHDKSGQKPHSYRTEEEAAQ